MSTTETTDSCLFTQLLVFTDCTDIKPLVLLLDRMSLTYVVYKNLNDPQGIGLLTIADHPELLVTELRDVLCSRAFRVLMQRHDLTMTGRGGDDAAARIDELETVVNNEQWPWALWYPMRCTPAFAHLNEKEQGSVLDELASGIDLSEEDFGHILLKSHALNRGGGELIHGVHARSPQHLSRVVEAITSTERFDEHIAGAGPFFVGRTLRGDGPLGGPTARW